MLLIVQVNLDKMMTTIDKLYKIQPVMEMVQCTFQNSYKPGKHQSIDEGMITYKEQLSNVQYFPSKPIKRGIKVWM